MRALSAQIVNAARPRPHPTSGQARDSFSGLTRSVIPRWPTTQTVSPTSNSLDSHSAFHSTPLSLTLPAPRSNAWVTFTRAPRADTGSWSPSQRSLTLPRNQTLIFSRASSSAATLSTAKSTICSAGAETRPSAVAIPTRIAPTPKNTATIPVAKNSDRISSAPRINQNQGSCSIFETPMPTASPRIIGGTALERYLSGDPRRADSARAANESMLHMEINLLIDSAHEPSRCTLPRHPRRRPPFQQGRRALSCQPAHAQHPDSQARRRAGRPVGRTLAEKGDADRSRRGSCRASACHAGRRRSHSRHRPAQQGSAFGHHAHRHFPDACALFPAARRTGNPQALPTPHPEAVRRKDRGCYRNDTPGPPGRGPAGAARRCRTTRLARTVRRAVRARCARIARIEQAEIDHHERSREGRTAAARGRPLP